LVVKGKLLKSFKNCSVKAFDTFITNLSVGFFCCYSVSA